MKEIISCGQCSNCVKYTAAGFTSVEQYDCSKNYETVDPQEDGCTLGTLGEPIQGVSGYDVFIGGNHTAHGRGRADE